MLRTSAGFVAPARWPRRYIYDGRCTSVRRGNAFTMGDASLEPDGSPLPRPSHPGLILLRPTDASPLRLVRYAQPLAGAIRSQWAMHIHSPRQYVYEGRGTSIRRGNTLLWAMPPLNRTARLCRGPVIPDEFASPDGCIAPTPGSLRPRVGRGVTFTMGDVHPFAEAIRLRWAMHIHSPRRHVHNGRCPPVHRAKAFTMVRVHPCAEAIHAQCAIATFTRTA